MIDISTYDENDTLHRIIKTIYYIDIVFKSSYDRIILVLWKIQGIFLSHHLPLYHRANLYSLSLSQLLHLQQQYSTHQDSQQQIQINLELYKETINNILIYYIYTVLGAETGGLGVEYDGVVNVGEITVLDGILNKSN